MSETKELLEASSPPIYLDYNATTPIHEDVVKEMLPYFTTHFGNPSSSHSFGLTAKKAIALARERVATMLSAKVNAPASHNACLVQINTFLFFFSGRRNRLHFMRIRIY
jgi:selenocysteine lyase/cysteine desulfurase